VTGASRGIGLALADALGDEGYALTISARKPDTLEQTAEGLRSKGYEVQAFAANMADEQAIGQLVQTHRDKYGRLDVLVNNAGVGVGAAAAEQQTKFVDLQLDVNLRAIVLLYRDCLEMLRAAGAEHRNAVVINLASIAGKSPSPWLSVYSATKAAVLAYTQAMNKELGEDGIKSTAFAPGFVDTDMTDFVKGSVSPEEMIRPTDIAEALRFLLRVSSNCVVPEIVFGRPNETV
jgi:short-subunit dehydrogenase